MLAARRSSLARPRGKKSSSAHPNTGNYSYDALVLPSKLEPTNNDKVVDRSIANVQGSPWITSNPTDTSLTSTESSFTSATEEGSVEVVLIPADDNRHSYYFQPDDDKVEDGEISEEKNGTRRRYAPSSLTRRAASKLKQRRCGNDSASSAAASTVTSDSSLTAASTAVSARVSRPKHHKEQKGTGITAHTNNATYTRLPQAVVKHMPKCESHISNPCHFVGSKSMKKKREEKAKNHSRAQGKSATKQKYPAKVIIDTPQKDMLQKQSTMDSTTAMHVKSSTAVKQTQSSPKTPNPSSPASISAPYTRRPTGQQNTESSKNTSPPSAPISTVKTTNTTDKDTNLSPRERKAIKVRHLARRRRIRLENQFQQKHHHNQSTHYPQDYSSQQHQDSEKYLDCSISITSAESFNYIGFIHEDGDVHLEDYCEDASVVNIEVSLPSSSSSSSGGMEIHMLDTIDFETTMNKSDMVTELTDSITDCSSLSSISSSLEEDQEWPEDELDELVRRREVLWRARSL